MLVVESGLYKLFVLPSPALRVTMVYVSYVVPLA